MASQGHDHRGIRSSHNHHHLHSLYRKQTVNLDTPDTSVSSAIPQVTTTLSVIQQVGVDSTGAILSTATVLANSLSVIAPTGLTVLSDPVDMASTSLATTVSSSSISSSTQTVAPLAATIAQQSQSSSTQNMSSTVPSSLSLSTAATSFVGRNSTSTIPSSSSSATNFALSMSNLTAMATPTSTSSTFPFTASLPFSSSPPSIISTTFATSSFPSPSSSQRTSTSTAQLDTTASVSTSTPDVTMLGTSVPASASLTASSSAEVGTATTGVVPITGSNASDNMPSTGAIAGGVVGGVAGISFLVLLIFMFLRWKRSSQSRLLLGNGADAHTDRGISTATNSAISQPATTPSGPMTQQKTFPFAIPAALAALTGHRRKNTQQSLEDPSLGSERGFYRVSGRHITSVLTSGGDGFGDNESRPGETVGRNTMSGGSFHRDSRGFYNGSNTATPPPILTGPLATAVPGSQPRDSITPVSRQGPARTPVIAQSPFADPEPESPPRVTTAPPYLRRPDGVGRSLVSQDGSHTSRFVEDV